MGSDLVINGSCYLQSKPAISEIAKRKRMNRSAKLKQCKLDARREQWLSQVKNKGCKDGDGVFVPPAPGTTNGPSLGNLETRSSRREVNEEGSLGNLGFLLQDRDLESPTNSPSSPGSSVMGNVHGGSRPERPGSSSSGSCSWSVSGDEEEERDDDDGILDDWEAVADALTIDDRPKTKEATASASPAPIPNKPDVREGVFEPDYKAKPASPDNDHRVAVIGRAWRPDDASRPLSLPNLSKQRTFPDRRNGRGRDWICPHSSTCPICYEELDLTDSIFLPCSCGFRLCLFCHKRILEADGRCPGCRKQYTDQGTAPLLEFQQLPRCSSMKINATTR